MASYDGRQSMAQLQGMAGGPTPTAPRTLASRLEDAASTLAHQCSRIESTLARINGTPRAAPEESQAINKINTTAPLALTVDGIEMQTKRLCELAAHLEQVA